MNPDECINFLNIIWKVCQHPRFWWFGFQLKHGGPPLGLSTLYTPHQQFWWNKYFSPFSVLGGINSRKWINFHLTQTIWSIFPVNNTIFWLYNREIILQKHQASLEFYLNGFLEIFNRKLNNDKWSIIMICRVSADICITYNSAWSVPFLKFV